MSRPDTRAAVAPSLDDGGRRSRAAGQVGTGPTRRGRRWPWLLVTLVALVIVVAVGAPPRDVPFDPDGIGPSGLRGVVDLLRAVDVEVVVDLEPPADHRTRALLPVDQLGPERRARWESWVEAGGTLVVAGRGSPLTQDLDAVVDPFGGFGTTVRPLDCAPTPREQGLDIDLAAVGAVAQQRWDGFGVPPDAAGCGALDDGIAWLVARARGAGTVVALGSVDALTNQHLDAQDNAVLVAALLGPAPGDRVVVVPRPPVGQGQTGILDLVAPRVWQGLIVLLVALVLGLVAVGRRLGRPVPESLPPVVAAAELASSVAALLQRAGDRQTAATRLRQDTRERVRLDLGLPATTPGHQLVEVAAARAGIPIDLAVRALDDAPVPDDTALLAVARAGRELEEALRSPRGTPPDTATA